MGHTVLSRLIAKSGNATPEFYDTYYVYDYLGNLCYVLPPALSALKDISNYGDATDPMQQYAYVYKYDPRNCCISKRTPGTDWTYMMYDDLKRMFLIQPGNMRESNQWFRLHYDACGNLINRERFTLGMRLSLQEIYDFYLNNDSYKQFAESIDALTRLTTYQETYGIGKTDISADLAFLPIDVFDRAPAYYSIGLKNYERLPVYGGTSTEFNPEYVTRVYYYDSFDRPIQIVEKNHLGGINRKSIKYHYTGLTNYVLEQVQPGPNAVIDTKYTVYKYDKDMQRLTGELTILNDRDSVAVNYDYDNYGRVTARRSGPIEERYTYNIRDWKTSQTNEYYTQMFSYETPRLGTSKPNFGGNISEISWRHLTPGDSLSTEHIYAFDYDDLSRIKDTKHVVDSLETTCFTEKGFEYDKNGNIENLNRLGADSLATYQYAYDGNQLIRLDKFASASGSDTLHTVYRYSYDLNGNMTHDGRHNLDIAYNPLNLPENISRDGKILVNYRYLSDGTKLSYTDAQGNGFEYLGSLVYKRLGNALQLESTPFSGGRFVATHSGNNNMEPHYFVTDHLGSTRVIVDSAGVVKERSDYYPFGLRWANPRQEVSDNRFRYNGKEEQILEKTGWTDFGARMYDPEIARWSVQDPMTEIFTTNTPYGYVRNNPINRIDVFGLWDEEPEPSDGRDIEPVEISGKRPKAPTPHIEPIGPEDMCDIFIPGWSFAKDAGNAWSQGNYAKYAGFMILGVVDMLTTAASAGGSSVLKSGFKSGAKMAEKASAKFTAQNFRNNLIKATGTAPAGAQAHHVLPQKFIDRFTKAGVDIHDPKFGVWLDKELHLEKSYEYNVQWSKFFEKTNAPTEKQVLEKADEIMKTIYNK